MIWTVDAQIAGTTHRGLFGRASLDESMYHPEAYVKRGSTGELLEVLASLQIFTVAGQGMAQVRCEQ